MLEAVMPDTSEPALGRYYGLLRLLLVVVICACGRTEHNDAPIAVGIPQAGAPFDAPSSGASAIDTSGQPNELVACPERSDPFAIQLPCLVGRNIDGPVDQPGHHVVDCKMVGPLGTDAIFFMLPLAEVPGLLNEPVQLPLEPTVFPPAGRDVASGDQPLVATLTGLITFTQVDIDGRAFVARLEQGQIQWGGDPEADFNCSTMDGPLWAIAGDSL
jgi:hypothetical protein